MNETTPAPAVDAKAAQPEIPPVRDLPAATASNLEIALLLRLLDESTAHWRNEMLYQMSNQFPEGWGRIEPTIDQIVWQPFAGGHSIGALLLHMAGVEIFWLHDVGSGRTIAEEKDPLLLAWPADQDAVDNVQWPTPPRQPLSWYFGQLDAVRARTKDLLQTATPDDVHTRQADGAQFTMRWLLGYVNVHESYHGGQCVLLALAAARQGG